MAERSTKVNESSADETLASLRTRVLKGALNVLAIAVPAVAGLMVGQAVLHRDVDQTLIILSAYTLLFPALRRCMKPQ